MELASRQVLLVSAPDAFSSWGGLFSLVFGVFYMLFGSRRMSPFGIIQKYMLRSRTKAMIANIYGNWKRDSSGNYYCRDSEGIPRMEDGIKGGSSYISLGRRASSSADLPLQDRQQVPLPYLPGNTDSSDSSNIVLEQQYMTQFSNTKAASDGNANNVYSLQQQIHHGEFLALRDQVEAHAKILRHLQGHEQRFKDTETLLKEFYLDMDLVDTKALAQDTALLTSTTVENVDTTSNQGKEQSSWRKSLSDGLFRTNQHPVLTRNTSDDSEERIALRESGFAMGFHGNPRADSPKHPNNRPNSSMEMIQYVHEP
ncbi:hypothetical protein BCR41DRAFT_202676 [Lobosporangium transversale]|uniref:Uncharacterized protein n=1 Tax=Lobosporangium transversale TaxID=64571 RepID=A0A1Y2GWG8_9FUNG|nr:hypothetical protein BCR41DRAFT_202676 [Lobosporangium transversale]ORZ26607.1 hypothetical protein BCR41DRAFT_202676 [Lobosporangium transversale]|eukprot:XP_021884370.1 hypothetical protein BCR41DRAFT_202676 [Lobosporangium transversale]